jgi:hypothetical protein
MHRRDWNGATRKQACLGDHYKTLKWNICRDQGTWVIICIEVQSSGCNVSHRSVCLKLMKSAALLKCLGVVRPVFAL